MNITIPELALVVLIGPSGAGKSSFARKHFKPTEVLSSDFCRGLVSDNENDQLATKDAFEVLHLIVRKRLAAGRLTVIDATNVQPESRKPFVAMAREFHCLPVAIVFDLPERICHERNKTRVDRDFGPHVIRQQAQQLRRSSRYLGKEGFRHIFNLSSEDKVNAATITREPLWNNRKQDHGPFDIIGDIHGCHAELTELLTALGYEPRNESMTDWAHPTGRKVVFLGDLVDRGPASPAVCRTAMNMTREDRALCVPGNHDMKLLRKLRGKDVQIKHGLAETLAQLDQEPPEFHQELATFLDDLVSHYVLDGGKLVVAHAGMKETMQGRGSGAVREFALYGETTGETDEFGLPIRYNWAAEYRGHATVVYGHTPVPEPQWLNRTINIDTGCAFGGKLTALRYPEMELVSVPARETYSVPLRPFLPEESQNTAQAAQHEHDDVLDMEDVLGKRIIGTRLHHNITIREENAIAALEAMSRFAANPKWLIYLPPTMSPVETSRLDGLLEHPAEAFAYFRHEGIPRVICEEKHMGSRAVVIACRDREIARRRFGIQEDGTGICYTRTGRRFFEDRPQEEQLLASVRAAMEAAGLWEELKTDWISLDCELMPWSAKAQELLRQQYAAVGAAGRMALASVVSTLDRVQSPDIAPLRERYRERESMATQYVEAYRRYCWPVQSLSDLRLAPFHILATEGSVHFNRNHEWHMSTLARLCEAGGIPLFATPYRIIDVTDPASEAAGTEWWQELTSRGGEGMVVKPLDFITRGRQRLAQPALKVRGREYLRIIYGPEYTAPEHLDRLRQRALNAKRSLALREFALGVEALERFVRREPLRRVHECVFGVLAMESEPVDPRL
ncbi:polynucleotide kinase-phosphatase [Verrucomicrobiota bacterium sgz303538]